MNHASFFAFSSHFMNSSKIKTISLDGNYVTIENVAQLVDQAEVIVLGTQLDEFTNRIHKETRYGDGSLEDFYTITDLKVEKFIKNVDNLSLNSSNILPVVEHVGLTNEKSGKINM
jgi:hypothetical protein